MSIVTITLQSVCAGGNHLTFTGSLDGGQSRQRILSADYLRDPISDEEMEAFIKVAVRLYARGRTNQQTRTGLQAGVSIVI